VYTTIGVPRECAYHASIAVPSSGVEKSARTTSQLSMSARSPSTISRSFPLGAASEVPAHRIDGLESASPEAIGGPAAVLVRERRPGEIDALHP
jgi:hypothetical protein